MAVKFDSNTVICLNLNYLQKDLFLLTQHIKSVIFFLPYRVFS